MGCHEVETRIRHPVPARWAALPKEDYSLADSG